jgi:multidrug efflux pump subunit AcrB
MFIALKSKPERKASADAIINRLRPKLAKVQGIQLFLQSVQDVRMGGRMARTQYQYTLQDADLEELLHWAPRMLAALRQLPELRDVNTDQQTAGLELDVNVDRDSAARLGITMRDVDNALYDSFGQRQVATTFTPLNQYRVVLEMKPSMARGPEALAGVYVLSSASGAKVPLGAIAKISPAMTPLSVNHQGQFPAVTLSFNAAPNISLSQAVGAIHAAESKLGVPASLLADFTGTAQAYKSSLASEKWLILAALVTVYIVLGMLYESYIHPITILSTLPSAGLGALLALKLCNMDLSIIGLVGIILLIGIVKKNAIMMIDFALELEREGREPVEAIYQACRLRFRPILMTTMAALLGGVPLAIGGGTGAELRQPLGVTVVGGLMVSQLLTLFITPVVYIWFDRLLGVKFGEMRIFGGKRDKPSAAPAE